MFRGAIRLRLDEKARIAVPTRYREKFEGGMVATIDLYQTCLLIYPIQEWENIELKLSTLSALNPTERRIQRLLLGHAIECQMDKAGRILIPITLRHHAKLKKHVLWVGQLNKFEIWDECQWHQQIEQDLIIAPSDMKSLSDKLKNLAL